MIINIFSIFPEILKNYLSYGVVSKAFKKKICQLNLINIRDFANNNHQNIDDYPFGGGAGMILRPDIIGNAIDNQNFNLKNVKFIYPSPKGKKFNQKMAINLSKESEIAIICGRYEGLDQRVIDEYQMEEISIGDYILSGGELPALTMIDAILRNINGVLGNKDSLIEESFSNFNSNYNNLEYPQYTRPREWKNRLVPDILISGNHQKIKEWQKNQSQLINNDSNHN